MESLKLSPLSPFSPAGSSMPTDVETFLPEGTCASLIQFAVEDGRLAYLQFTGGCDGNLKAVAKLTTGMEVAEVVERLSGITCGRKSTSCVDQLCLALAPYLDPADK